jgi:hypothetical protein
MLYWRRDFSFLFLDSWGQAAVVLLVFVAAGMLQGLGRSQLVGLGLGCFDVPKVHM